MIHWEHHNTRRSQNDAFTRISTLHERSFQTAERPELVHRAFDLFSCLFRRFHRYEFCPAGGHDRCISVRSQPAPDVFRGGKSRAGGSFCKQVNGIRSPYAGLVLFRCRHDPSRYPVLCDPPETDCRLHGICKGKDDQALSGRSGDRIPALWRRHTAQCAERFPDDRGHGKNIFSGDVRALRPGLYGPGNGGRSAVPRIFYGVCGPEVLCHHSDTAQFAGVFTPPPSQSRCFSDRSGQYHADRYCLLALFSAHGEHMGRGSHALRMEFCPGKCIWNGSKRNEIVLHALYIGGRSGKNVLERRIFRGGRRILRDSRMSDLHTPASHHPEKEGLQ